MQCPYCEGDSSVTETRLADGGLRRRRVCGVCRRRFTTYEKVGAPSLKVAKRSGRNEPFDSDKLVQSLSRVSRGRAALTATVLRRVARDIEATLVDSTQRLVSWRDLVVATLARLEAIDPLAAQRMRANYLDEQGVLRLDNEPAAVEAEDLQQLGLPGVEP